MQDFGRIKEQLGNLETENQRLKEISLVQARNDADQANAELGRRLNRSLADVSI